MRQALPAAVYGYEYQKFYITFDPWFIVQSEFIFSKLTIETLELGVKYVQS